jgi:hypothetical protein
LTCCHSAVVGGVGEAASADELRFDDIYATNAPEGTIARGDDYGRLSFLRSLGVETMPSTLEKLVLAESRCHQLTVKVVANGKETGSQRLHGNTIIFAHAPEGFAAGTFAKGAVQAAVEGVRFVFVGPKGSAGKLERSALLVPDVRLSPYVLWNFVQLRHRLHGNAPPPLLSEVQSWVAEHSVLAHIKKSARWINDAHGVGVESAAAPSDVANVRSVASSGARCEEEEEEAEEAGTAEEEAPDMEGVGLMQSAAQGMAPVIQGIAEAVEGAVSQADGGRYVGEDDEDDEDTICVNGVKGCASVAEHGAKLCEECAEEIFRVDNLDWRAAAKQAGAVLLASSADSGGGRHGGGDGVDGGGDAAGGGARAAASNGAPRTVNVQRVNDPSDDYGGAAEALYATWWPLFPLGRGLVKGKALSDKKIRHMFLYFDNRFAHDLPLLFHLANVKLRHAVNKSVGARVKSSSSAFADFAQTINDPNFAALLKEAKSDPTGAAARQVTKMCLHVHARTCSHPQHTHHTPACPRPRTCLLPCHTGQTRPCVPTHAHAQTRTRPRPSR